MPDDLERFLLTELISSAIHFEEESVRFYEEAVSRVQKADARKILRNLASEEQQHRDKLASLAEKAGKGEITLPKGLAQLPSAPASGDMVPDIASGSDASEIVEVALRREELAYEFYRELAIKADTTLARDTFQFLALEEQKHIAFVGEMRRALEG